MKKEKKVSDTKYIRKLLRGDGSDLDGNALVYVGNGAKVFAENNDPASEVSFFEKLGGFFDLCALQIVKEKSSRCIYQLFEHETACFAGYTARRKREGVWEWLLENGIWERAQENPMRKKMFVPGEEFALLSGEYGEVIILDAQWREEDGTMVGCGHAMYGNSLMAHAFGGMNGKLYHNTMKAFEHGIRNGYKYFEVDLSYTSDGRLVLCHGWTKANCKHTGFKYNKSFCYMPYWRVMTKKVHGNPIISARGFYKRVCQQRDCTFEIDFHNVTGKEMEKRMQALVKDFKYDASALDRLLIQVYSKEMFEGIQDTSYIKHYQYLVGKNIHDLDDILTFSLDYGICALAVRYNLAKAEFVQKIKNSGLYVMCYTVNGDTMVAKELLNHGVNTLCTDYITEDMLAKQENGLGYYPFFVYYNSADAEALSRYEMEEEVIRTKSGALEYQDSEIWKNDGQRSLKGAKFEVKGKKFAGWKLRVNVDGKQLWFCKDGLYHGKGDLVPGTEVEPYLFSDGQLLPRWKTGDNFKYVMVATWEKTEDGF